MIVNRNAQLRVQREVRQARSAADFGKEASERLAPALDQVDRRVVHTIADIVCRGEQVTVDVDDGRMPSESKYASTAYSSPSMTSSAMNEPKSIT